MLQNLNFIEDYKTTLSTGFEGRYMLSETEFLISNHPTSNLPCETCSIKTLLKLS